MPEITWIPVATAMPESSRRVLFYWKNQLGNSRTSMGWWVDRLSCEADGDWLEGDVDYDEDRDTYFIPEGWYEWGWETEYSAKVDTNRVTHWAAIPKGPEVSDA